MLHGLRNGRPLVVAQMLQEQALQGLRNAAVFMRSDESQEFGGDGRESEARLRGTLQIGQVGESRLITLQYVNEQCLGRYHALAAAPGEVVRSSLLETRSVEVAPVRRSGHNNK